MQSNERDNSHRTSDLDCLDSKDWTITRRRDSTAVTVDPLQASTWEKAGLARLFPKKYERIQNFG